MSPDWADAVSKQLLDRRVVRVFGRLDDALVADLAAQLWSLDALGDEPGPDRQRGGQAQARATRVHPAQHACGRVGKQ